MAAASHAQVAMDATGSYSQNFDVMGSGTTLPANWSSTRSPLVVGTGSSNSGGLYNFGNSPASDRALGSMGSGSTGTFWYGVLLHNTTGAAITNIQLAFTGEQWRAAKTNADVLPFHYQVSTSPITINGTGTWTGVTALNFTSPTLSTAGAINGNAAANRTVKAATTIVASLPAGSYLALRWTQVDNSGSDHGLAIDDLTLTWIAGPPPPAPAATFDQTTVGMAASPLVAGSSDQVLFGFSAASTASGSTDPATQSLTGLTLPTTSNTNGALANVRLYRSTDATLNIPGDALVNTFNQNPANIQLTGMAEALNSTPKYYFVVADVNALVTPATPAVQFSLANGGTAMTGGTVNAFSFNSTNYAFIGSGSPALEATGLDAFGAVCINTDFPPTATFTLTGSDLTAGNVIVGPLDGFAFFDPNTFEHSPTLTIAQDGSFSEEIIVRFLPTAEQPYNGNIPVSGGGAGTSVAVNGSGVNTVPTIQTGPVSDIGLASASAAGSVDGLGCSDLVEVGIEYSTTNGFTPGTGTQVAAASPDFFWSVALEDLASCTGYYYRAYATNNGGTGYGEQSSFSTAVPSAPAATAATGIFSTGFTATWDEVPGATGYVLDVSTSPIFGIPAAGPLNMLAQWTFAVSSPAADAGMGIPANVGREIAGVGTSTSYAYTAGASGNAISTTQWNGSLEKYWQVEVNAEGYGNVRVSSKQRSSGTGPRDFKLQYRIGAGGAWTDVAGGGNIAVADNFTSGVLSNVLLPGTCNDAASVFLRWVKRTDTSVNNAAIGSTGTSRMDDLVVQGNPIVPDFVPGYDAFSVSGTSHEVTGLTLGTTYYYRVRAVMGVGCESANSNTISVVTACDPVVLGDVTSNAPVCSSDGLELAVEVLGGEGPPAFTWSGTGVFTPDNTSAEVSVTGAASGIYTVQVSNGCSNAEGQVAVEVTQATAWYADGDGDGLGDPLSVIEDCEQPEGYVANASDACPVLWGTNGDVCDAGPGFVLGVIEDCICVGQPCTTDLVFETVMAYPGTLPAWAVRESTTDILVASGGGTEGDFEGHHPEPFCLPDGDFYIVVNDVPAGATYKVYGADAPFVRIIDNTAPVQDQHQVEAYGNSGGTIQLPVSGTRVLLQACDKYWWRAGDYLVANEDVDVKNVWDTTATNSPRRANTGYDFWFYDPNGGYSYVRQRRHNQADGYGNVGSARTCHMRVNSTLHGWTVAGHIPNGLPLNVRVRTVVNGVPGPWGPACRFVRDEALAACPPTTLWRVPETDPKYSCDGATRNWTTHTNQRIFAHPVSGAGQYRFRFTNVNEGYDHTRTNSTYYLNMGWNPASTGVPALTPGSQYQVTVQANKGNGLGPASDGWCMVGDPCTITICNAQGNCSGGMIGGEQNSALETSGGEPVLGLWPNPNRGELLNVNITGLSMEIGTIALDIVDLSGKRVFGRTIGVQDGTVSTVVSLDGELAAGMYMVQVLAGDQVFTERLVVQL